MPWPKQWFDALLPDPHAEPAPHYVFFDLNLGPWYRNQSPPESG